MEAPPLAPPVARSTHSSDLPHVKQEAESDEDESKGKKRSVEELQKELQQWKARAIEAEKVAETESDQQIAWAEEVTKIEIEMGDLTEELRISKDEATSLATKYHEMFDKYNNALNSSLLNAQRAKEECDNAALLRNELDQATKDINLERLKCARAEEEKAEASEIILGLMGKNNVESKVLNKISLTPNEVMALQWKYPQLLKEVDQLKKEIDEKKIAMGRVECERDQLRLELNVVRNATAGELTAELSQKLAHLEKSNAALREEKQAIERQNTEAQLLFNKLNMDNDDLQKKLREVEERSKQSQMQSPTKAVRRSLSSEQVKEMTEKLNSLEQNNAELRREMERLNRKHKEQHDEAMDIIEKKAAENYDLLDRNQKLADRLDRKRRDTPPSHDKHKEDSKRSHSKSSRSNDRGDRSRKEESSSSSELKDIQRKLDDAKRAHELLEADRNDLRASLRAKSEKISELETDVNLKGTKILHLEIALQGLRERLAKEETKTKEQPALMDKIEELTFEVDGLKKSVEKSEKEMKRLEGEVEEQKNLNVMLVTTKAGQLMEELTAAKQRIKELESEHRFQCVCSKDPGGSSAKRARIEEEQPKRKEPTPPPPPFVLQAAIPKAAPAMNGNQWRPLPNFTTSTRKH